MPKTDPLLLDAWREVGRHIDLHEAIDTLAAILGPVLPLRAIEILRLDTARADLESLAAHRRDGQPPMHGRRIGLTRSRFDALMKWCRETQVSAHSRQAAWPATLAPLQDFYADGDVLFGVLKDRRGEPEGIVVLLEGPGDCQPGHGKLLAGLLEPLSVALENDARLRELEQLRAAAEADRQSLLNRLGRDRLSDEIVGAASGLRGVLTRADQVARSDSSVLLLGETGSGKEVIARAIHDRSPRADAPFIRVNCGALPPELIDSELFGHEKGSFTGATARRKGWFEQADGGSLFLDEVGELPPTVQVRLLRVLQDGVITRVGGEQSIQVDVRVIAATHRDLAVMVQQGAFREDLWYRIAVFPILIPPLRERIEDIPELARHFARRASIKLGVPLRLPTADEIEQLRDYPWPGNVRELSSVIERAAILGEGDRLEVTAALGLSGPARREAPVPGGRSFITLDQAVERHIRAALTRSRGKVEGPRGAARLLGLNPHTLRSKMRKLGIDPRPFRED